MRNSMALRVQDKDAYLTMSLKKGSYEADRPPHLSQGMMRAFTVN
jgi:hypothetical protein